MVETIFCGLNLFKMIIEERHEFDFFTGEIPCPTMENP